MATNAFAMMMGASRNRSKDAKVSIIPLAAPTKKKLGRPPIIRKAPDLTPLVISLVSSGKVVRKRYDVGDSKIRMDNALSLLIKSKGRDCKRIAAAHSVSRRSLWIRYHETRKEGDSERLKRGPRCILVPEIEGKLKLFCEYMASCNLAVDRPQVGRIAKTLAKECGITGFKASSTWIVDFLKRHDLMEKLCQPWEHMRQAHTNAKLINDFFTVLQAAIRRCEDNSGEPITGADVFNLDETGFDRNIAKNKRVVVKKRSGRVRSLSSGSGSHVTMVNCISASGVAMTPYFIMKGEVKPKVGTKGVNEHGNLNASDLPNGVPYCMQTSAYVDDLNWTKTISPWLIKEMRSLLPEEKRNSKWQLLVLDGCVSHTMTFEALRLYDVARILIVGMPSHTSADLQPLDVSVFKAVKTYTSNLYRDELLHKFQVGLGNIHPKFVYHSFYPSSLINITKLVLM
jgi:DDE superfamily endonuclease/Tc5 transposase DNA-binding domain